MRCLRGRLGRTIKNRDLTVFQVEQKEEKLRQTELSLGRKIEREFAEVIAFCFKSGHLFLHVRLLPLRRS